MLKASSVGKVERLPSGPKIGDEGEGRLDEPDFGLVEAMRMARGGLNGDRDDGRLWRASCLLILYHLRHFQASTPYVLIDVRLCRGESL